MKKLAPRPAAWVRLACTVLVAAPLALSAAAGDVNGSDVSVPVPQGAVAAFNRIAGGPHPGYRANHAKGVLLTGYFSATKDAASVSKAAHLQPNRKVPVLVRFSDPTGIPNLPDADPHASPHGMAIRFTLPDGSSTDIVALSTSYFPVAKPEQFVELLNAIADSAPGTKSPTPLDVFMKNHPTADAWAHVSRPPPQSFATLGFWGINAFKFTNAAGRARYGRYQIVPEAGEQALSPEQAKTASPDYLMNEIQQRVAKGPVTYRLRVQLAAASDPTDDPTAVWPANRPTVDLGTITVDGVAKDQVAEQRRIMFTPLALIDGIAPSSDPILLIRPAAYAVSFAQRLK